MGTLLLAITLLLWAFQLLGWVAVSNLVLGIFALLAGIVLLLESIGVVHLALPSVHRQA
jgi:hypothetical protein